MTRATTEHAGCATVHEAAVLTRMDPVSRRELRKGKRGSFANPGRTCTLQSSCRGTQRGRDAHRLRWAVCLGRFGEASVHQWPDEGLYPFSVGHTQLDFL